MIWLIGLGMGLLFYLFPIHLDTYGDAIWIRDSQFDLVTEIPEDVQEELLALTLHPSRCRPFMLSIFSTLAKASHSSLHEVYTYMGILFGVLFVVIWLSFVKAFLARPVWRFIMGLVGITAPLIAAFCGHLEVYAPTFVLLLVWCRILLKYLVEKLGLQRASC